MARRCGPTKSCGMRGGLFNPFFQNGVDLTGQNGYSSQGGDELTLDSSVTVLGSSYNFQDRNPDAWSDTPGSLYMDGRTYLFNAQPWSVQDRSAGALTFYDKNNGFYGANISTTQYQSDTDRHLTTEGIRLGDYIYIGQEKSHLGDFRIYRSSIVNDKDIVGFKLKQTLSGVYSRGNFIKTGDNSAVLYLQEGDENIMLYTFNPATGDFEDGRKIFEDATIPAGARMYPSLGTKVADEDGWYYLFMTYLNSTLYDRRFVVKTQDFVNMYNLAETYSFDISSGPSTAAVLTDNGYRYIFSSGINIGLATPVVVNSSLIYDMSFDPNTLEMRMYKYDGSSWTSSVVSPTVLTISGSNDWALDAYPIIRTFYRDSKFWAVIAVRDGLYRKFHLFSTSDEGQNWTDHGDLTPGRNEDIQRANVPHNVHEIPSNENFIIWSCDDIFDNNTGLVGTVYALKAAFGSVQSETPVTPDIETVTDYNSVSGSAPRFIIGADQVTTSGSNITGITNQANGAKTISPVNNPQLTGGRIVNSATARFDCNFVSDFVSDTEATIVYIGSWTAAVNALFLGVSDDTHANHFMGLLLNDTQSSLFNAVGYRLVNQGSQNVTLVSSKDVTTTRFVAVITIQGTNIRIRINGKEYTIRADSASGTSNEIAGEWISQFNARRAINRLTIFGLRRSSGSNGYAGTWDKMIYYPDIKTPAAIRGIEAKAAADYSITLDGVD